MSFKPLSFFKTNAELKTFRNTRAGFASVSDLRKHVPIAVIDDERFLPEANLQAHGYRITQLGDIKSIEEVKEYRIVLCDLMGVGQYFDPVRQGASLIEEIKERYPSIMVVAYTGSSLGSVPGRAARDHADDVIKKDADIAEWRALLDELIQDASNPAFIWHRTRLRLAEMEIDTKAILMLEDAYVRSILSEDTNAHGLSRALATVNINQDARAIVQGLISSAIFKFLFGG